MSDEKGLSGHSSSPSNHSFKSPFSDANDIEPLSNSQIESAAHTTKEFDPTSDDKVASIRVSPPLAHDNADVCAEACCGDHEEPSAEDGKLFSSDEEDAETPLKKTDEDRTNSEAADIQTHLTRPSAERSSAGYYGGVQLKNATGFVPTATVEESRRENEIFEKALSSWSNDSFKRQGIKNVDGVDSHLITRVSSSRTTGADDIRDRKAQDSSDEPTGEPIGEQTSEPIEQSLDWESIDEVIDIPKGKKLTLLLHQRKGVRWMLDLFEHASGGILADDMGLGKTVQCCVMLRNLFENGMVRRILILCPKSVLGQWEDHILRICGRVIGLYVFHGPKRVQVLEDFGDEDIGRRRRILLTTYETFKSNADKLFAPPNRKSWGIWIADEATSMKNPASANWKAASQIEARCRIMLTGTPIMNNYGELWALIDLAVPNLLGEYKTFKQQYAALIDKTQRASEPIRDRLVAQLRRQLHPYLMRRTKEEIFCRGSLATEQPATGSLKNLEFLPAKTDLIVLLELSFMQYELYRGVRERLDLKRRADVLVNMSHLLSLCRHPVLCLPLFLQTWRQNGNCSSTQPHERVTDRSASATPVAHDDGSTLDESAVDDEVKAVLRQTKLRLNMSDPDIDFIMNNLDQSSTEQMRQVCPKLECLHKLLPLTLKNGHSALVFSYSTATLDLVEACVMKDLPEIQYLRIDGSVDAKNRQKILHDFSNNDSIGVMLLSTKAGGLGLNLTKADRVIMLDPNWNPALDNQAIDRAYRIGQKREVIVYRLICGGTIEDNMLKTQLLKIDLSSSVLAGTSFKPWLSWRDMQSLFHLSRAAHSPLKELLEGRVSDTTASIHGQLKDEFGEDLSPLEFLNADSIFSMDDVIKETRDLRSSSSKQL